MTQLDDTKMKEINVELEKRFETERHQWRVDIEDLVKRTGDTRNLAEAQVTQLSYRQIVQEKLAEYRILLEKRQELFDKKCAERFREYTLKYDIKLSAAEKSMFIKNDCAAWKLQISMISCQIQYLEESVKTLDNLGFAIKNKIEIVSQQIM